MFGQTPYGGYNPWPPQQPVVFIPPQTSPQPSLADQIAAHLSAADTLKKIMKETKDDKPKEDKPKGGDIKVLNMMLLMVLLSPITGPVMSYFFHWGLGMMH